jgi:hypothetical protein
MFLKARFLSLIFLVHSAVCCSVSASNLKLAWDPSPSSVSGYYVYSVDGGTSQTVRTDVGNVTTAEITSLDPGHKYSIYVTAYDSKKIETKPSNAITVTAPSVAGSPSESSLSIENGEQLWIKGSPGIMYGIQASSDLKNWIEIGQVKGALNAVPFSDGPLAGSQMRFYRVAVK